MAIDPTRLYTTLLNTGLQQKDNPLYQVIHQLIEFLVALNIQVNSATPTASIPIYANNAAAIAGGLIAGEFYRTGANPDFVAVVH